MTKINKVTIVNPPNPTNYSPHKQHGDLVYLGGMGYLDASLRKFGVEVNIVDAKHRESSLDAIVSSCSDSKIVGISSHWGTIGFVDSLSTRLKREGKIVVVGGTLPSSYGFSESNFFMQMLNGIDFCLIGEGEIRFPQLVSHLTHGETLPHGILYRERDLVRKSNGEPSRAKLEELPKIDFSRFPHFLSTANGRTLGLQTERGCYANCNFCYKLTERPGIRKFPLGRVEEEFSELLNMTSPRQIMFYDETFTAHEVRAREIARIVQSKKIPYTVLARADNLNKSFVNYLKETGCQEAMIGVETFDEELRKRMNKGLTTEAIIKAIRSCEEVKLPLVGFFMAGYPGETSDSLKYTIRQIEAHQWLIPRMRPFMPLPGTKVYQQLLSKSLISEGELFENFKRGYIDSINQDYLLVNVSQVPDNFLIETSRKINALGDKRMSR